MGTGLLWRSAPLLGVHVHTGDVRVTLVLYHNQVGEFVGFEDDTLKLTRVYVVCRENVEVDLLKFNKKSFSDLKV